MSGGGIRLIDEGFELGEVDLSQKIDSDAYEKALAGLQKQLMVVQQAYLRSRDRAIIVFEGWDAAGKGGAIRRLTSALDPRDYSVIPVAKPTEEEKHAHYLWRFWRALPRNGRMAVFDRSWYGRVLVERIEGFCSTVEWQRAYGEINEFEQQLSDRGILVLKFWLHIDPDEQLRRFQERERILHKQHKLTDEDYRNRARWDAYHTAVDEMVEHTDTPHAPWHLIPGNHKRYARVAVIETVVEALRRHLD